jgi:transglutaminase-like putative cysteine protease
MLFEIVHRTAYRYGTPVTEACVEARLTPPALPWQQILAHRIVFSPPVRAGEFQDPCGNTVTFAAMAERHDQFTVENRLTVRTGARAVSTGALGVSVAEARQIFGSRLADVFDHLQPTAAVPLGGRSSAWAKRFFRGGALLGDVLNALNTAIHKRFAYRPGTTENSTPLATVWKNRAGVCQDFAHVMLAVLRTAGLPSRYVCGYIESAPAGGAGALLGSLATHAWVEVLLPGMEWAALDPTNNQWCGERHVTVACGRDFDDAAPVRGTFKGSGQQKMSVRVRMRRIRE